MTKPNLFLHKLLTRAIKSCIFANDWEYPVTTFWKNKKRYAYLVV